MTVADIGAGSGYYVVRLSPIVGSNGRIIAQDVVPEYLRDLRNRVRNLGLQNVTISLGEPHDPRLPADLLDIAILVHMYRIIYSRTRPLAWPFQRLEGHDLIWRSGSTMFRRRAGTLESGHFLGRIDSRPPPRRCSATEALRANGRGLPSSKSCLRTMRSRTTYSTARSRPRTAQHSLTFLPAAASCRWLSHKSPVRAAARMRSSRYGVLGAQGLLVELAHAFVDGTCAQPSNTTLAPADERHFSFGIRSLSDQLKVPHPGGC